MVQLCDFILRQLRSMGFDWSNCASDSASGLIQLNFKKIIIGPKSASGRLLRWEYEGNSPILLLSPVASVSLFRKLFGWMARRGFSSCLFMVSAAQS